MGASPLFSRAPRRDARRLRRLLRCALALAAPSLAAGCFVELSGGASAVMGGNERQARFAPSFGVAAGVVYDAYVARIAAGSGGDALVTSVNTRAQGVVAGPAAARLDLGTDWSGRVRSPQFRVALGGSFGAGSRIYPGEDGALEARPYGVYHAYAMPSWLFYRGNPVGSMLAFDLAFGPGVFFALGQRGITDLWAVGGEARITLSLPITQAGMRTGAHVLSQTRLSLPTVTDADIADAHRMAAEGLARDRREGEAARQRQLDSNNRESNQQYCVANGGVNCGR